jgi:hypothetical protein
MTDTCEVWGIEDWAGKRPFPDALFSTPEEATAFLDDRFPDDDDRGEFYVVRLNPTTHNPE